MDLDVTRVENHRCKAKTDSGPTIMGFKWLSGYSVPRSKSQLSNAVMEYGVQMRVHRYNGDAWMTHAINGTNCLCRVEKLTCSLTNC